LGLATSRRTRCNKKFLGFSGFYKGLLGFIVRRRIIKVHWTQEYDQKGLGLHDLKLMHCDIEH